jgi:hypothetical protein
LPLLGRITVRTPCTASWDEMSGDDASRFCFQCSKTVYDLGAMDPADAEAFLEQALGAGEVPCVRLFQRPDGRVLTSECSPGARGRHARRAARTLVAAALATTAAVAGADRATRPTLGDDVDPLEPDVMVVSSRTMMGAMVVDEAPEPWPFDEDGWATEGEPENERLVTAARTERRLAALEMERDRTLPGTIRLVR